jgi:hypothetical protein
MTHFLDLLEAYHHWCVRGDDTRLEHCQAWLETVVDLPRNETSWHQLGVRAVDWLTPLPPGWAPHWRILSPREQTLTVEALDDLDAQRPGAVAAALPPSRAAAPEPTPLGDGSGHWRLSVSWSASARRGSGARRSPPSRCNRASCQPSQPSQKSGR